MTWLLLLLLAGPAAAAVLDAKTSPVGTLTPSAQTANGATANSLKFGTTAKFRAVVFTLRNTAGTATGELQINCTGNAADWAIVTNGTKTVSVGAITYDVMYPACEYRMNFNPCTSCSAIVSYTVLPEMQ